MLHYTSSRFCTDGGLGILSDTTLAKPAMPHSNIHLHGNTEQGFKIIYSVAKVSCIL